MEYSSECPPWLKLPQDEEELISCLLLSETEFYQQLQVTIRTFEQLFTEKNERKLFIDDLIVLSKYSHKFINAVTSQGLSVEEGKLGIILNDTMFIHEKYRMTLISQIVKYNFKRLVLTDYQYETMLYAPIARLLHLKSNIKALIDCNKGFLASELKFGAFQLQLCYMKISKIFEFCDSYPAVTDWAAVVNFDTDHGQIHDLRVPNSEAAKQPAKRQCEIDVKLLIELVREYRDLCKIRDKLLDYVTRIHQFTDAQLNYCKLLYQFFALYEFGSTDTVTSLYTYESYINVWSERTRDTNDYLSQFCTKIVSKLSRIVSIMSIVLSSMQSSRHWYKSFHLLQEYEPAVGTAEVDDGKVRLILEILHKSQLKRVLVSYFFQFHLQWMRTMIGERRVVENKKEGGGVYEDIVTSYYRTVDLTLTALRQAESMY